MKVSTFFYKVSGTYVVLFLASFMVFAFIEQVARKATPPELFSLWVVVGVVAFLSLVIGVVVHIWEGID